MCLSEGAALHIYSGSALTFSHKFSQPSNADGMDPYITNARGAGKAVPWGGPGSPPHIFGRSVKPILIRGGRLCPPYYPSRSLDLPPPMYANQTVLLR